MIDNLATVATQSLQLWLRRSESLLGWDFPVLHGQRLRATLRHVRVDDAPAAAGAVAREDRPATLGYFCGSLRMEDPDADPQAVVTANATRFLDDHADHFWPGAAGPDGFDWDQLVGRQRCAGDGPDRLAGQYVRANVEGSQRYVQSLPGSQRHRLRVDESGYDAPGARRRLDQLRTQRRSASRPPP